MVRAGRRRKPAGASLTARCRGTIGLVGYSVPGHTMMRRASQDDAFGPSSRAGRLVVRAGVVCWALVGIAIVTYGAMQIAAYLRVFVIAVGLAVLIVILLEPAVSWLQRMRVPRPLGTAIMYVAVLGPLSVALWLLGGLIAGQVGRLVDEGPRVIAELELFVGRTWAQLQELGVDLGADSPQEWFMQYQEEVIEWALDAATAATAGFFLFLAALIGPVIAFYMLSELPRIRSGFARMLPQHSREETLEALRIIAGTVGAFFRGQLIIAVLVGILSTVALALLGVPYAALVGTIAGVTNLVPFFGPIVGAIPGVALGFAEGGAWLSFWVVVLFVAIQQFESHVMSPLILGRTVRLRPVAVIIGMLAGAVIAGLLGMILAVPALASIHQLYSRFWQEPDEEPPQEPGGSEPAPEPV